MGFLHPDVLKFSTRLEYSIVTVSGINIFSGADTELGAALTNPTELAREKRRVVKRYSVSFDGKMYPDVEQAYHVLAGADAAIRDALMIELIAAKFQQHPELLVEIQNRGGTDFLTACSHWTNARTEGAQAWEGQGLESRFIRNLVQGFMQVVEGNLTENGQRGLF